MSLKSSVVRLGGFLVPVVAAACGSGSSAPPPGAGAANDAGAITPSPTSAPADGGAALGDATTSTTNDHTPGASCASEGATVACFSGPAALRNQPGCKDGVQTCAKQGGEFLKWSACTGDVTTCASDAAAAPPKDGGGEGGATVTACVADCVPGAVRWCDDPVYCNWGKQSCTPAGSWGACTEVNEAPTGCTPGSYDQACCVTAGACCQNLSGDPLYDDAGAPVLDDAGMPVVQDSIGHCAGIACH